jgi:hypothetical protein
MARSAKSMEEQIRRASTHLPDRGPPLPRFDQVRHWLMFAREYLKAAELLCSSEVPFFLPRIQVGGHAIECAIKSYVCASGKDVPRGTQGHNLVTLLDLAIDSGLTVDDRDLAMVVHINHQYFQDLQSKTGYKSRYPSDFWEPYGGTIPDAEFLRSLVSKVCDQATAENERLNRNTPSRSPAGGEL